jgi:hypothetical protein
MSYDEEGVFGARTTFYGSRWARCVLVVVLALDSVARHVHLPSTGTPIMMDPEQIQSESLDQVKFPS